MMTGALLVQIPMTDFLLLEFSLVMISTVCNRCLGGGCSSIKESMMGRSRHARV